MNIKQLSGWVFISLCVINAVNADTSISNGNNAPSIIGDNTTVNYGYSKETIFSVLSFFVLSFLVIFKFIFTSKKRENIGKIITVLTNKHQLESQFKDEQIKALTQAVSNLSKGQGIIGSKEQIDSAMQALAEGKTEKAKILFTNFTQKGEQDVLQTAETYRNLGALAYLDNTQEALQAYRRATQLDPDNAIGWNQLGLLLQRVGELDEAIVAYQTVLTLGEASKDKELLAIAYGNLGIVYRTRGELDKAIEFYQKALAISENLGDKEKIAIIYGNLGGVYQTRGALDKAIEFYQKALVN